MKVHVSFTKGTQTKLQGKTEKYVVLIWVHDMWHHCAPYIHPYQLHDDCTRSLIFIFIFQVFLLQLFLAETFSSLVVIIGPRFQAIKLAQIKEKKFEKKKKRGKKSFAHFFFAIATIIKSHIQEGWRNVLVHLSHLTKAKENS